MNVQYNNLFKKLIDKGMSKTEFAQDAGISANTLAKLSKNEYVSMDVLVRLCRYFECTPNDLMEVMPEKEPK